MKNKIVWGLIIITTALLAEEQYQDIIINNNIISGGVRHCAQRYEALKSVLNLYQRPFTMLDIGASQGFFSFKTAFEFPQSTCVMIEGGYNDSWEVPNKLLSLCKANTSLNNIIFLKKRINIEELERLASCEHFDVVLAFNIIHHFPHHQWQRVADAMLNLGDNIIIETPPANDSIVSVNPTIPLLESYLLGKAEKILCETPRHTTPHAKAKMMWFKQNRSTFIRKHWLADNTSLSEYVITSNFQEKKIYKAAHKKTYPWHKGINLLTFKMLNGVFPEKDPLKQSILSLAKIPHGDFNLWNMIIQGNNLELIDLDDTKYNFNQHQLLNFNLKLLDLEKASEVKSQIYSNNQIIQGR